MSNAAFCEKELVLYVVTLVHSSQPYYADDRTILRYSFIWREGGPKMLHIESFCHRLKMVWINKILDSFKIAPWKTLFIDKYNNYGAIKYGC